MNQRDRIEATRHSLVARLSDREDQKTWREFFEAYWQLIYAFALRAGLREDEAHDVVQETVLCVVKNITKYERAGGSFKGWLLNITRWRIVDQFRLRRPGAMPEPADTASTAPVDRLAGDGLAAFHDAWEEEWQNHRLGAALTRLKSKVSAEHYQVFDCLLQKGWSAPKTARELGVNIAQVYLIKHRLSGLLKKEIAGMET
jgi:RNA polymerase sigma-70 factor (ECF subfamily)